MYDLRLIGNEFDSIPSENTLNGLSCLRNLYISPFLLKEESNAYNIMHSIQKKTKRKINDLSFYSSLNNLYFKNKNEILISINDCHIILRFLFYNIHLNLPNDQTVLLLLQNCELYFNNLIKFKFLNFYQRNELSKV